MALFALSIETIQLTGVIMSKFSWDLTLQRIFRDGSMHGLHAVLESDGEAYSYVILDGVVQFV